MSDPEQLALMAVGEFLKERGFHVNWFPPWEWEEFWVLDGPDDARVLFWFYFVDGDLLMIAKENMTGRKWDRSTCLDRGGRFLELADPACFDQIVERLEKRLKSVAVLRCT